MPEFFEKINLFGDNRYIDKAELMEAIAKLGAGWVVPGREARVHPTIIALFQDVE
jgi:hypothetical protein